MDSDSDTDSSTTYDDLPELISLPDSDYQSDSDDELMEPCHFCHVPAEDHDEPPDHSLYVSSLFSTFVSEHSHISNMQQQKDTFSTDTTPRACVNQFLPKIHTLFALAHAY